MRTGVSAGRSTVFSNTRLPSVAGSHGSRNVPQGEMRRNSGEQHGPVPPSPPTPDTESRGLGAFLRRTSLPPKRAPSPTAIVNNALSRALTARNSLSLDGPHAMEVATPPSNLPHRPGVPHGATTVVAPKEPRWCFGDYWMGFESQFVLRILVLCSALLNCIIFPAQLAFGGVRSDARATQSCAKAVADDLPCDAARVAVTHHRPPPPPPGWCGRLSTTSTSQCGQACTPSSISSFGWTSPSRVQSAGPERAPPSPSLPSRGPPPSARAPTRSRPDGDGCRCRSCDAQVCEAGHRRWGFSLLPPRRDRPLRTWRPGLRPVHLCARLALSP